jgi:thioredoxin 1
VHLKNKNISNKQGGNMAFDAPIHTNEANLDRVLNAGLPVMMVFWQRNCAPCDDLAPVLDRLAKNYAGKALIVKVDASAEPGLARRYDISHLPSTLFFRDGQKLATAVGAALEPAFASWLDYLSQGGTPPATPSGPSIRIKGAPSAAASSRPASPPRSGNGNGKDSSADGKPVTLTDATFDQAIRTANGPVLVDFWAEWCGPCKMVAPTVAELAQEFAGRAVVAKLNVDENPAIAQRHNIMSIPSLLIFKDGRVVDQVVGVQPIQVLRQRLAAFAR